MTTDMQNRRASIFERWVLLASVVVCTGIGCSSDLGDFARWAVDIPVTADVVEYPAVPLRMRRGREVGLEEDLVIAERGGDANYVFGAIPPNVAVDSAGNVYAVDGFNARVQLFDQYGEYRRTFGRRGQGPGEFQRPSSIFIADDLLVVGDVNTRRFSYWKLDGEHIRDVEMGSVGREADAKPNPDGATYISRVLIRSGASSEVLASNDTPMVSFVKLGPKKETLLEFARFPWPENLKYPPGSGADTGMFFSMGVSYPNFALDPGRAVYLSPYEEYQIFSYEMKGVMRWALRVAYARTPISDEEINRRMRSIRRRYLEAERSEIDWPEQHFALDEIRLDGHGHLYVFPDSGPVEGAGRPVDVYSTAGERLFAGTIQLPDPTLGWQISSGDQVLGVRRDEDNEWEIVRYRLVEPFN